MIVEIEKIIFDLDQYDDLNDEFFGTEYL